jgi:hypothetical protein
MAAPWLMRDLYTAERKVRPEKLPSAGGDELFLSFHIVFGEDPPIFIIPSGYSKAKIEASSSDASSWSIRLKQAYSSANVALSAAEADISAFAGIPVSLDAAISGGARLDILLKAY